MKCVKGREYWEAEKAQFIFKSEKSLLWVHSAIITKLLSFWDGSPLKSRKKGLYDFVLQNIGHPNKITYILTRYFHYRKASPNRIKL